MRVGRSPLGATRDRALHSMLPNGEVMVMVVQSEAWETVGERFESLGTHLRKHFDEVSADATAEGVAFEKSVRGLLSALEDGFSAARDAVRDPMLRDDVTGVAASVREALLSTFEGAGEQVRERLARPARAVRATSKPTKQPTKQPTKKPAASRPAAKRPAAPKAKPAARKTAAQKPAATKRTAT